MVNADDNSADYRAYRARREQEIAAQRDQEQAQRDRERFRAEMREHGIELSPEWDERHEADYQTHRAQQQTDRARGYREPARDIGPDIVTTARPHISRYFEVNPAIGRTSRELTRELLEAEADLHRRLSHHVWEVDDQRARVRNARDARNLLN